MNMNKKVLYGVLLFIFSFILFNSNVYAECNTDTNKYNPDQCDKSGENGHKCMYYGNRFSMDMTNNSCEVDPNNCLEGYKLNSSGECIRERETDIDTKVECSTRNESTCTSANGCKWNKSGNMCEKAYVLDNPCSQKNVLHVLNFLGYILWIAILIVPLLIVGFGTYDVFKAVIDKDEKSLFKQLKVLGIRVVIGIIIFFLPKIVYAIFDLTNNITNNNSQYQTCIDCLLEPTNGKCDYSSNCVEGEILGIDGLCYRTGTCGSYTTSETCPRQTCKWTARNGCTSIVSASSSSGVCSVYTTQNECEANSNNCYWSNGTCYTKNTSNNTNDSTSTCSSNQKKGSDGNCYTPGKCSVYVVDNICSADTDCKWDTKVGCVLK